MALRIRTLALTGAVTLAAGLQFVQPPAPRAVLPGDGPMADHLSVPPDVDTILRAACYDCHSGETRWPWYSRVSPLSWYIAHDVQHARWNLDFSQWPTDPVREPTPLQELRWMCKAVREGRMPPRLYRLAHPAARLDQAEKDLLCAWTTRTASALRDSIGSP